DETDVQLVPLNMYLASDPTRRRAVVGGFNLDAAIQMNGPFAVLITTEWFQRQWKQCRFFFGEHRRDLPLCGAVNASIRPPALPLVEISLRLLQTLKAKSFQRRSLRVPHTRLNFAFSVWIA